MLGEFNLRHFSDLRLPQCDEPPGDIDTDWDVPEYDGGQVALDWVGLQLVMIFVKPLHKECFVAVLILRVLLQVAKGNYVVAKVNGWPNHEAEGEDAEGGEDVLVNHADPELPDILIDQWDEYHVQQADKRFHNRECY